MLFSKWMETTGMKQAEAARKLEVSESTISLILSGDRRASPELAQKIVHESRGKVSLEEVLFPDQYGAAR